MAFLKSLCMIVGAILIGVMFILLVAVGIVVIAVMIGDWREDRRNKRAGNLAITVDKDWERSNS